MVQLKKRIPTASGLEVNGREAIMNRLFQEALKGKIQAIELMLKIVGEYPAEKVQVSSDLSFAELLMRTGTKEDGKEEDASGQEQQR